MRTRDILLGLTACVVGGIVGGMFWAAVFGPGPAIDKDGTIICRRIKIVDPKRMLVGDIFYDDGYMRFKMYGAKSGFTRVFIGASEDVAFISLRDKRGNTVIESAVTKDQARQGIYDKLGLARHAKDATLSELGFGE